MPSLPVEVVVPTLTSDQQKMIRVGMSAKVKITITYPPILQIPVTAVKQKQALMYVHQQQADGSFKDVAVVTGPATAENVVIQQGLKEGDKIAVPH